MMKRSLLNSLETKDVAWNWGAKDRNPMQIAGRGDGTAMSIGVFITPSALDARSRDGPITSHPFMLKQRDRKGGEIDGKNDDFSNDEN
jgi:hypothetical protein